MRRAVLALACLAPAAAGGVAVAATAHKPLVAEDAKGDVAGPLDLTRFSIDRGVDGRVRASLTVAAPWDAPSLKAPSGPPGSLCVRLWTVATPPDTPADHLVCVTADRKGALRGSVLRERPNKLPVRVASADVSRPSSRTVTVRFAQSAIGNPAKLEAAGESTRPGCPRVSCVDVAPNAPATLALPLRDGA
jgi:hypothetical protein